MKVIGVCILIGLCSVSFAQKKEPKFGDIKPEDFKSTVYSIDSSANAVVLFDIGSSYYESIQGGLSVIFKRHKRIRILNKNAFDMATIGITLYSGRSTEERIEDLHAATYNLEGGQVKTYKLDKASIFKDQVNKYFIVKKFTLPNLKEGSIIEFDYSLNSPFPNFIHPWSFQGSAPVLRSEYEVTIPNILDFIFNKIGDLPLDINDVTNGNQTFYNKGSTFPTSTVIHKFGMKNVPAIKKEKFTTTLENHISRINFQLSKIDFPGVPSQDVMRNWYAVSKDLLKDDDFGADISRHNGWLQDEMKIVTGTESSPLDKAKKIFAYIRDNMTCTNHSSIYLSNPIKKVFQNKNGNVADINLLLTAALINQGLKAEPVLLSTRDNGKANDIYPVMSLLNYVICCLKINDKEYYLDASHNKLGFGKLDEECYNGSARLINQDLPRLIDLSADSVMEYKVTNVFFINDAKEGFSGTVTTKLGDFESNHLREKLAKESKADYIKELKKDYVGEIKMSDLEIDSLKSFEDPVTLKYNLTMDTKDDMLYVDPIFAEAYKENPFKSAERNYPVEMPSAMNEVYILRMEIPDGYKVEEMPKSARVNLNEREGSFEYMISKSDNIIQLRSTVKLKKANFLTEDYQTLRDFFAYIVKKHSEQIVFKNVK